MELSRFLYPDEGGDHMTYLFIGMLLGMIVGLAIGSLAAIVKYTDYEIKRLKKELAEKA